MEDKPLILSVLRGPEDHRAFGSARQLDGDKYAMRLASKLHMKKDNVAVFFPRPGTSHLEPEERRANNGEVEVIVFNPRGGRLAAIIRECDLEHPDLPGMLLLLL